MWTVAHSCPARILSRGHFPEWTAAANWLRAMMQTASPPGISDAMLRLRSATPETAFKASVAGHSFSLSVASNEPEPATDLISVSA